MGALDNVAVEASHDAGATADMTGAESPATPQLARAPKRVRKPREQPSSGKRETLRLRQRSKESSRAQEPEQELELLAGIEGGQSVATPLESGREPEATHPSQPFEDIGLNREPPPESELELEGLPLSNGGRIGSHNDGFSREPPPSSDVFPGNPESQHDNDIAFAGGTTHAAEPDVPEPPTREDSGSEAVGATNMAEEPVPAPQAQPAVIRDISRNESYADWVASRRHALRHEEPPQGDLRHTEHTSAFEPANPFAPDAHETAVAFRPNAEHQEQERIEEPESTGGTRTSFVSRIRADLKLQLVLLVILPILIGALASYAAALLSPNVYAARSEIVLNISSMDWNAAERFLATQIVVVKARSTLAPVAEATKIPLRDLEKAIDVEMIGSSDVIGIQYANRDPSTALKVVEAVTARYLADLRDYEQLGNGAHRILLPATLLEDPVSLKPLYAAIVGALVGLVIGVAGLILRTQIWPIK